jgi:hypothetical protein
MIRKILLLTLILFLFSNFAYAENTGPTLSSVTDSILLIDQQNGYWYPKMEWWLVNPKNGQTVKVILKDSKGKVSAYAVFDMAKQESNTTGQWYMTTGINKLWPSDDNTKTKTPLAPGKYTMQIESGGQIIWETPFEVKNYVDKKYQIHGSANHYYITGPWKDIVYVSLATETVFGLWINFWFEGTEDKSFYNPDDMERRTNTKIEIKKDGNVIISGEPGNNDKYFCSCLWSVNKQSFAISYEQEIREKILSSDGNYDVIVYFEASTNNWVPVAQLTFPVKGGKIQINPELSGDKVDAKHRINTSTVYYSKNQADRSKLPLFPKY